MQLISWHAESVQSQLNFLKQDSAWKKEQKWKECEYVTELKVGEVKMIVTGEKTLNKKILTPNLTAIDMDLWEFSGWQWDNREMGLHNIEMNPLISFPKKSSGFSALCLR